MQKLVIGSDHGGYELKNFLYEKLKAEGCVIEDVGSYDGASVDYPDIAEKICAKLTSGEADLGIALCGTGIGISIACNKIRGIRAALCADTYSAEKARQHNNANVLALGGRTLGPELALAVVKAFLGAEFEGGRHGRRVAKIMSLEAGAAAHDEKS